MKLELNDMTVTWDCHVLPTVPRYVPVRRALAPAAIRAFATLTDDKQEALDALRVKSPLL